MISAVYPGTFDPVTNGHLDVIRRARFLFDRLIVAVAANPRKTPLFTVEERVALLRRSVRGISGVRVDTIGGLVVDFALRNNAPIVVRGLRAVSDFEYEMQMALMNRNLRPRVDTVFLMPSQKNIYLNSGLVKEIAAMGGSLKGLVPSVVARALREKLA